MHISLYLSKKLAVIAEKGSLPAAFPFYQTTKKKRTVMTARRCFDNYNLSKTKPLASKYNDRRT